MTIPQRWNKNNMKSAHIKLYRNSTLPFPFLQVYCTSFPKQDLKTCILLSVPVSVSPWRFLSMKQSTEWISIKQMCVCVRVWDKSECVCGVTRLLNVRHIKHTHWLTHSRRASTQRSQALFCSPPPPLSHFLAQCFLSSPPIIPHAQLRITSAERWKLPVISNLTFSRCRSGWVYPSHASVPTKPFITEEFLKTAPVSNGQNQKLIHPLTTSKKL